MERRPPSAFRLPLLALLLVAGCGSDDLMLKYQLDGILPTDVVRVETRVDIDPSDPRGFYVDQPFRQVARGVGYEVRDFDGSGRRTLLVTHDATLGYVFAERFDFRLLPPVDGAAPRLSIVARAVGISDMLGETMALSGHFGHGATLAVDLTDQRCAGRSCDVNQACCAGSCASVQSDVDNCGACGAACAPGGDSCSGAACRCAGGSVCAAGSACCSGLGCFDLQHDPFHCGACDHACNPGEQCVDGRCACGSGAACPDGVVCCGNGTCSATGCACGPAGACNFPDVCCNGACANPRTDDANCGACGHACATPLHCAGGACACNGVVCGPGDACCASGCANTDNDPDNCGACGHACAAGEVCSGGRCLCGDAACAEGQLCCAGHCVNPGVFDCGACGRVCHSGEQCTGGSCSCNGGPSCVGNQVCCPAPTTTTQDGGCFDLATDPNHCGGCGIVCPAGQACDHGNCVDTPCKPPCSDGNQCVGGACQCNGEAACDGDQTCCPKGCKSLRDDPKNCGMCGHACDPGSYCCDGICTPPDNNNCTGCGQGCGALGCCKSHTCGTLGLGGLCLL